MSNAEKTLENPQMLMHVHLSTSMVVPRLRLCHETALRVKRNPAYHHNDSSFVIKTVEPKRSSCDASSAFVRFSSGIT